MFPTGLPSIARLKAKFDPKFAGFRTIKRPAGRARRAAAVSMEAAQRKTRIRKSVVTDVNVDFMPSCSLGIRFWPAWRVYPMIGIEWQRIGNEIDTAFIEVATLRAAGL